MNTKNVCKVINTSPKALRIYEDLGIIAPARDENNYRNYKDDDILKLKQVIVLKEMGIPLKNIKDILEKEIRDDNKVIRALNVQLKAVNNRINELQNIKLTLEQNINEALMLKEETDYKEYFSRIDETLKENQEKRLSWLDKWEFDSWADKYDNSVVKDITGDLKLFEKYDFVLETLAEKIEEKKAVNVLDIGCGTANLNKKLKSRIHYTGMDQSIEMLLQAKIKYPDIKLRLGNFLDKPFALNEFDVLVSSYAFHHLKKEEKEIAVSLMLEYLKPGGTIIIADLMFLNQTERLKQKNYYISIGRKDLWDIIQDEYYTDIEELKKYAEAIGCQVNCSHIINFTWILEIKLSR
ncbi:MAG: methyltransferase domain-containing protein [Bacillota bacterium]|nr:methyltransferase domain-containing protein [Bacillota bacterium]